MQTLSHFFHSCIRDTAADKQQQESLDDPGHRQSQAGKWETGASSWPLRAAVKQIAHKFAYVNVSERDQNHSLALLSAHRGD